MSAKEDITIPLEPDCYYHIYNKGNNSENIFFNDGNYKFFLNQIDFYMSNYFHFYAYCLIPNHFHLLIRVKSEKEIFEQAIIDFPKGFRGLKINFKNLKEFKDFKKLDANVAEKIISEKFRRFFLSYAKAINKQQKRSGSLFRKIFRRKKVSSDGYFRGLIWYIHNNPVKHGVFADYKTYKWSSYYRFFIKKPSKLNKKEIFEWFDDEKGFIEFHENKNIDWNNLNNLIIEDD